MSKEIAPLGNIQAEPNAVKIGAAVLPNVENFYVP